MIDHYLPRYDVTEVQELPVDAPPEVTYPAIRETDLGDPMIGALFAIRELPGVEFVVAAVGRFWRRDYGWHAVAPDQFLDFDDPGYAKLAVSFRVQRNAEIGSLLRYEARTATTDDTARTRFRRYWRVIRPGVAIVMRRALKRIRTEAERRQAALLGAT